MPSDPPADNTDGRTAHGLRSRQRLLDAAMIEFAEHGYAGARVAAIAARSGVNKQLISYHFGGKKGLYEQLQARWFERERELRQDDPTLSELVVRYLEIALSNPESVRLAARQALDGTFPAPLGDDADLADMRARQARGELAADLDPGAVLLAIMGMVTAPILIGGAAADLIGGDYARYGQQLSRILELLAGPKSPIRKADAD